MGAELGLRAELAGGVSLGSALTWSDNKYLEYVVDSVHYGRPGATRRLLRQSDRRRAGVHRAARRRRGSRRFAPFRAQLALDATAGYWADDANSVRVPGYSIWSLTLGTRDPVAIGGGVAIGGFVTVANLFDRRLRRVGVPQSGCGEWGAGSVRARPAAAPSGSRERIDERKAMMSTTRERLRTVVVEEHGAIARLVAERIATLIRERQAQGPAARARPRHRFHAHRGVSGAGPAPSRAGAELRQRRDVQPR